MNEIIENFKLHFMKFKQNFKILKKKNEGAVCLTFRLWALILQVYKVYQCFSKCLIDKFIRY